MSVTGSAERGATAPSRGDDPGCGWNVLPILLLSGVLPVTVACAGLFALVEPVHRVRVVCWWALGSIMALALSVWAARWIHGVLASTGAQFRRLSSELATAAREAAGELGNLRARLAREALEAARASRRSGRSWN